MDISDENIPGSPRPTELYIIGENAFINNLKNDSDKYILDLNILKKNFKIDNEVKILNGESVLVTDELPAFTQLTYSYKENQILFNYSNPPIGPVELYCYCSKCKQIGPNYHLEDCSYPEKNSLYLTFIGVVKFIINSNYNSGKYDDL